MKDLLALHKKLKSATIKIFNEVEKLKVTINLKDGNELVTNIDLFVEEKLIKFINENFPNDKIISEEFFPLTKYDKNRYWTIDPIDGTSNFANGLDLYCLQVALIEDKEVIYSFIYLPKQDLTFHAFKDNGAYLNDKLIKKEMTKELSNKLLSLVGFSNNKDKYFKAINFGRNNSMKIRNLGSAGIELAYTSTGYFTILYSDVKNLWDIAPGYLLARETGCVITNGQGNKYKLGDDEIIVYNNKYIKDYSKLHLL